MATRARRCVSSVVIFRFRRREPFHQIRENGREPFHQIRPPPPLSVCDGGEWLDVALLYPTGQKEQQCQVQKYQRCRRLRNAARIIQLHDITIRCRPKLSRCCRVQSIVELRHHATWLTARNTEIGISPFLWARKRVFSVRGFSAKT